MIDKLDIIMLREINCFIGFENDKIFNASCLYGKNRKNYNYLQSA